MQLLHFHFKNQNGSLKGTRQNVMFAPVPRWVPGQISQLPRPWWVPGQISRLARQNRHLWKEENACVKGNINYEVGWGCEIYKKTWKEVIEDIEYAV